MKNKILSTILATMLCAPNAYANNNLQYEQMAQQLSKQLQTSMHVMNDPKLIKANAKYIKSLYDALIDEGFTKTQALELVSASLASKK